MPRIQLDTGNYSTSPSSPSSHFSSYLPSPNTSSHSRRGSLTINGGASSLPFPLSLPKRKLVTLLGFTILLIFLFGWSSSGPPSESGLFAWGRRGPEGEYDPHGSGEGADADEIGGGRGVVLIDMEKSETELDQELGFLAAFTAPVEVEDPPHLQPASLQTQLTSLIYFLAEGGIVGSGLDTTSEITVHHLLDAADQDLKSTTSIKKAEEGWASYIEKRYPLVIFSKSFCPYSRKAKSIISSLNPSPAPLIIEVDLRPDSAALKSLLGHLTSRNTFPNILLGFVPLGGGDEIELLSAEGVLGKKFKAAGMRVNN